MNYPVALLSLTKQLNEKILKVYGVKIDHGIDVAHYLIQTN